VAEFLSEDLAHVDPAGVSILGRTHGVLNEILEQGLKLGLSIHKVGQQSHRVQDSRTYKTFQAVTRMLVNPRDNLAFLSFGAGWLGLDQDARAAIRNEAMREGCSMVEVCRSRGFGFVGGLAVLEHYAERTVGELFQAFSLLHRIGETWLPAETMFDTANQGEYQTAMTPAEWLAWMATRDMHAELEAGQDRTTLLTCHAAKGLEWGTVIIVGMDKGEFPKKRAVREGHLEEERRLAYVAMTRAKKRLVIFTEVSPSKFIEEAGL
jgi:ATP-dependent exoDNAse (exonuclease V) beta subunit